MATVAGCVPVFFIAGKNDRLLAVALGLAAGVMLGVSFWDLYPEAERLFNRTLSARMSVLVNVAGLFSGIAVASLIDRFVPHEDFDPRTGEKPHRSLYRTGMLSAAVIGLHNFPEGVATFMAGYENAALGFSVAAAVAVHNIPEGIIIALPVYYATRRKTKAFLYTALSGSAEPLGALAAFAVLRPFIGNAVLGGVFSMVAGIMIYVAVEELIPSSRQYGHDRAALRATFAGIGLMPLTRLLYF